MKTHIIIDHYLPLNQTVMRATVLTSDGNRYYANDIYSGNPDDFKPKHAEKLIKVLKKHVKKVSNLNLVVEPTLLRSIKHEWIVDL